MTPKGTPTAAKRIRYSFSRRVGQPTDTALYALPCDPPPWRTDHGATGDWWQLAETRDGELSGVYLRRFEVLYTVTTYKAKSTERQKRVAVWWAAVAIGRGAREESRASALRVALLWITAEKVPSAAQ